jgi:hypothetical protein
MDERSNTKRNGTAHGHARYDRDLYGWADAYEDARIEAAAQTRLSPRKLPTHCPYAWDEIMERAIEWPQ